MEELICREGTIHSIIFQNAENGYTVLRLLTEEGEVVTVVGCIPCVAPGEHLTVSGVWEQHPQHGEQLRGLEMERSLPEEEEEIFSYLSSGVIKGVGPATARNIVERFGAETFDILEQEPERLTGFRDGEAVPLNPEDILRFYGEDKEVRVQTLRGDVCTVRLRLYELEQRLDRRAFLRVSHSEIVNWKRVTALDLSLSGTIRVTLEGGVTTYVSRRYVKKIKEVLGI